MCRSKTPLVGRTILQHYSRKLQGICAEQAHQQEVWAEPPHSAAAGGTLSRLDCHTDANSIEHHKPPAQLQEVNGCKVWQGAACYSCQPG